MPQEKQETKCWKSDTNPLVPNLNQPKADYSIRSCIVKNNHNEHIVSDASELKESCMVRQQCHSFSTDLEGTICLDKLSISAIEYITNNMICQF
jgi:hypothetical protein